MLQKLKKDSRLYHSLQYLRDKESESWPSNIDEGKGRSVDVSLHSAVTNRLDERGEVTKYIKTTPFLSTRSFQNKQKILSPRGL